MLKVKDVVESLAKSNQITDTLNILLLNKYNITISDENTRSSTHVGIVAIKDSENKRFDGYGRNLYEAVKELQGFVDTFCDREGGEL